MERKILTYLFALVFCALGMFLPQSARAQEEEQQKVRPIRHPETSRMIEKKDIRLVILYDEDETPSGQAAELARNATVDAIASGAKLTKADAARQMPGRRSEGNLGKEDLGAIFPPNSSVVFFAAKQKGGDCVPPPDCGCGKGPIDCVCIVWRKKSGDIDCMCRMCPLGMGSATGKAYRLSAGQPTIVLVLGDKLQSKLGDAKWWERNREWFNKEVWQKVQASPATTNLTIKTKSSPK